MKHTPVESSNVKSIGYDPESQTLEVAFASGGIYRYANVPAVEHHNLMAASSKGGFLAARIKPFYAASTVGQADSPPEPRLCLAHTPKFDKTGRYLMGEPQDSQPPMLCALPDGHEGAHAWEGLCGAVGPYMDWFTAMADGAGYVLSFENSAGGPGGTDYPVLTPKNGG